ncbi:hypothetical protein TorRG33x02_258150 [Trema orientale]|uniref:Uncharacterized protein n=1 Tax=Trema orientale TaxID=63057 RepID=A0A2P5D9U0_TREOI|nr:hypothetical protein TorRG33x02_258150 [Trema orientale]
MAPDKMEERVGSMEEQMASLLIVQSDIQSCHRWNPLSEPLCRSCLSSIDLNLHCSSSILNIVSATIVPVIPIPARAL